MFRDLPFRYARRIENGREFRAYLSHPGERRNYFPMTTEFQQLLGLLRMTEHPTPGKRYSSKDLQPFLNPYITMARYMNGKPIIMCNQSLSKIILVVDGEFCLMRSSIKGGSGMIARVWGPEFLGIPQLVTPDKVFYSNIIASSNCLAVKIDCDFFLQAMRKYAAVSYACVESMSRAMSRNYTHIERLNFFSARENLIYYIHRKWTEAGANEKENLCIAEKRTVIASELGVTIRTVCRALSELKKEGLITTEANGNICCTPEQIRRICELNP